MLLLESATEVGGVSYLHLRSQPAWLTDKRHRCLPLHATLEPKLGWKQKYSKENECMRYRDVQRYMGTLLIEVHFLALFSSDFQSVYIFDILVLHAFFRPFLMLLHEISQRKWE